MLLFTFLHTQPQTIGASSDVSQHGDEQYDTRYIRWHHIVLSILYCRSSSLFLEACTSCERELHRIILDYILDDMISF